ncbi:MAG: hypothetical protein WC488_02120 [Candidatus Micrarchaeia archaeon]
MVKIRVILQLGKTRSLTPDEQRKKRYAKSAKQFERLKERADELPEKFKGQRNNTSAQYENYCKNVTALCRTAATNGLIPTEAESLSRLVEEGNKMNALANRKLLLDRISQWAVGVTGLAVAGAMLFPKAVDAYMGTNFSELLASGSAELMVLKGAAIAAEIYCLCKFLSPLQRLVRGVSAGLEKLEATLKNQGKD